MFRYFKLMGALLIEKNAWAQIVFFGVLQILSFIINPEVLLSQKIITSETNITGWVFFILASFIVSGFTIQVYSNRMKNDKTILPEFDIAKMIIAAFKIIPLNLIWGIYAGIYTFIAVAIVYIAILTLSRALLPAMFVLMIPFAIMAWLGYPVLIAAYTKTFQLNKLVNPLTMFEILRSTGLHMLINFLSYSLALVALAIIGYAVLTIMGVSITADILNFSSITSSANILLTLLGCIFVYFYYLFQITFIARTCDITKEYLEFSELMENEYYDLEDEEPSTQMSDEDLFAKYARNKPEEDDDIQY